MHQGSILATPWRAFAPIEAYYKKKLKKKHEAYYSGERYRLIEPLVLFAPKETLITFTLKPPSRIQNNMAGRIAGWPSAKIV